MSSLTTQIYTMSQKAGHTYSTYFRIIDDFLACKDIFELAKFIFVYKIDFLCI